MRSEHFPRGLSVNGQHRRGFLRFFPRIGGRDGVGERVTSDDRMTERGEHRKIVSKIVSKKINEIDFNDNY